MFHAFRLCLHKPVISFEFKNCRKSSSLFRILKTFITYNKKIDITNKSDIGFYKSLNKFRKQQNFFSESMTNNV